MSSSVAHDYSRAVSFNNVSDEYLGLEESHPSIDFKDINFGYGSSLMSDISASYYNVEGSTNNYTLKPPIDYKKRKSSFSSTSSTPRKSILKNKLSPQQLQYNLKNSKSFGINYHENLDDLIKHYEPDDQPVDDTSNSTYGSKLKNSTTTGAAKTRRKSYSDMTPEELIALDPQFQTTKSKIDQFKFDSQKTYYLSERKSVVVPKLESHRLKPSSNYKSVNLNYKHDHFRLQRTILTLVDGTTHTMGSLVWMLQSNFLSDGDHVIIGSLLPTSAADDSSSIFKKCEQLISSFLQQLKPDLVLKVTVDYVINEPIQGATTKKDKDVLNYKVFINNLFNQYTPNLLVFGNKCTNPNFKYPMKLKNKNNKDKYLIKFSSYLIKYSTIPVILVNSHVRVSKPRKHSLGSTASIGSSQSSIESVSVKLEDINNDMDRFEEMMRRVSDKSFTEATEYMNMVQQQESQQDNLTVPQIKISDNKVSFNDNVRFNKVHNIYNSQFHRQSAGSAEMYKVKSLLDNSSDSISVTKSSKSEEIPTSGLTIKKIKNGLKKEPVKQEKKKSFWKKIF
ncbi:hypothetical protein PSN45_002541 [Yamadazyma tenuis]|uniref:Uncharacterized protein n=1 Tax=Candida tenuis (strain ATCC 10573 / BCRC 21748 / CBS 615 / JCM 9827 / NBRC 10315 / NRRL Y-1498 / VKM Y-70) TaxID=590646 RepID=G3B040_CANTC|nr:uncharacterized protein CANTEDRAFT_133611 [Yamadazyma tenuis ATCC 10573]EGV65309.1 hypothetical protein CANTEDRAFT_133611 [Yamadazyma tenuis ATCC 10573]WEJ95032.1 hypothetical protein PSN45_002541 [Yamadazyma tenuis]